MSTKEKVDKAYKGMFGFRLDKQPGLYYFSWKDLEGLHRDDFSFANRFGETLRGGFYYCDNYSKKDTLVVFSHGYGGGHISYIKEIYHIAQAGFRVLAIDTAGCVESDGEALRGFNQQSSDTYDLISYLKSQDEHKDLKLDLVGHSMGGYTSLNLLNYIDGIHKVVALASPISASQIYGNLACRPIRKELEKLEEEAIPGWNKYNALDGAKKISGTKILFMQSLDDSVIKWKYSGKVFSKIKNPNFEYKWVDGVDHQTCFTKDAALRLKEYLNQLAKCRSIEEAITLKESSDWNAICDHDSKTMSLITDFLKD